MAEVAFAGVTKRFGDVVAVDDLTLDIADDEFLGTHFHPFPVAQHDRLRGGQLLQCFKRFFSAPFLKKT